MGKNLKNERIGEQRPSINCGIMEIVEYNKATDIIVEFINTGYRTRCTYNQFKKGNVKDNFVPSICGVGYIGDTTIKNTDKTLKKSYMHWRGMIDRCYNRKLKAYEKCYVCDEWLCYANFEKWYIDNYYEIDGEIMNLDKDILVNGNKIYSPETCIFVPERINLLFVGKESSKRKYPTGVYYMPNRTKCFLGRVISPEEGNISKYFLMPEEAFNFYKQNKEKIIKHMAEKYKDMIPQKLYNAMYSYEVINKYG